MSQTTSRTRRVTACAVVTLAVAHAACSVAHADTAARRPLPVTRQAPAVPFAERWHAVQHGGITRAANSALRCVRALKPAAAPCSSVQKGADGVNGDYELRYNDVDHDRHTYDSSRATLRLPRGARVDYARLYWGANLRAGEHKPFRDAPRVLVAEPGGQYKQVRADSLLGHRVRGGADAYQASADVTGLVRAGGGGEWTVAQVDVAKGHSAAGAWGGWTLVAGYRDPRAPRRHLALWDGFQAPDGWSGVLKVALRGLRFPVGARGRLGVVAYDGDRGRTHRDSLTLAPGDGPARPLADRANPVDDVLNSTVTELGHDAARRPDHRTTLGYDSDVLDAGPALRPGGTALTARFVSESDDYLVGALFAQVDAAR